MKVVFWLGVCVLCLPPLLRFTSTTTRTLLDTETAHNFRMMPNVLIDRGARFAIIALAAAWLAPGTLLMLSVDFTKPRTRSRAASQECILY